MGLEGLMITPMFACESCAARIWASVAPEIVIFMEDALDSSTSLFKRIRDDIISAPCASMTRGISPWDNISTNKHIELQETYSGYAIGPLEPFPFRWVKEQAS